MRMLSSIDLMFKTIAATTLLTASAACARTYFSFSLQPGHFQDFVTTSISITGGFEISVIAIEVVTKSWKCPGCNENEKYVLAQLQERTKISDRNALAAIMGNIKSESNFHPNICEGGARVPYDRCHRGGYGLIQWTTQKRYDGLGTFCKKYGCNPSSIEGQTRYMINEDQFQKLLPEFEGRGFTVSQYMVPSYYWLGWGIKGYREQYAYNYTKKLVWS